ncbi:hypothetical protein [Actinomadura chibensis]|uniref:Integral membrane protein n=1 Tax=Actinomadura chibensis TaxID=392828 RepID=A0A5D0NPD7_9ACTN|nr:hypothetical protein [Actinomadura chibensis]TYB46433.1 hypothetical protein FXF69_14365 [Actinomadura chibensis]
MNIAALATWLVTALGGFFMLGTWISRGGARGDGASRLPVPVIFGHFALAATGLVVWIVYVVTDTAALAWTAFGLLLPVALLGFVMFARWLGSRVPDVGETAVPAERGFPIPVVMGHGLFAVATLVLVLITAIRG